MLRVFESCAQSVVLHSLPRGDVFVYCVLPSFVDHGGVEEGSCVQVAKNLCGYFRRNPDEDVPIQTRGQLVLPQQLFLGVAALAQQMGQRRQTITTTQTNETTRHRLQPHRKRRGWSLRIRHDNARTVSLCYLPICQYVNLSICVALRFDPRS